MNQRTLAVDSMASGLRLRWRKGRSHEDEPPGCRSRRDLFATTWGDNAICIEGERKSDFEEDRDGLYRMERSFGTFYRVVPLPDGVSPDAVKAMFKDGVLEVTAPLPPAKAAPKGRVVEIQEPTAPQARTAA